MDLYVCWVRDVWLCQSDVYICVYVKLVNYFLLHSTYNAVYFVEHLEKCLLNSFERCCYSPSAIKHCIYLLGFTQLPIVLAPSCMAKQLSIWTRVVLMRFLLAIIWSGLEYADHTDAVQILELCSVMNHASVS